MIVSLEFFAKDQLLYRIHARIQQRACLIPHFFLVTCYKIPSKSFTVNKDDQLTTPRESRSGLVIRCIDTRLSTCERKREKKMERCDAPVKEGGLLKGRSSPPHAAPSRTGRNPRELIWYLE